MNDTFQKAAFFFFKDKRLGKNGKLAAMVKASPKNTLPDLANVKTDDKNTSGVSSLLYKLNAKDSILNTKY